MGKRRARLLNSILCMRGKNVRMQCNVLHRKTEIVVLLHTVSVFLCLIRFERHFFSHKLQPRRSEQPRGKRDRGQVPPDPGSRLSRCRAVVKHLGSSKGGLYLLNRRRHIKSPRLLSGKRFRSSLNILDFLCLIGGLLFAETDRCHPSSASQLLTDHSCLSSLITRKTFCLALAFAVPLVILPRLLADGVPRLATLFSPSVPSFLSAAVVLPFLLGALLAFLSLFLPNSLGALASHGKTRVAASSPHAAGNAPAGGTASSRVRQLLRRSNEEPREAGSAERGRTEGMESRVSSASQGSAQHAIEGDTREAPESRFRRRAAAPETPEDESQSPVEAFDLLSPLVLFFVHCSRRLLEQLFVVRPHAAASQMTLAAYLLGVGFYLAVPLALGLGSLRAVPSLSSRCLEKAVLTSLPSFCLLALAAEALGEALAARWAAQPVASFASLVAFLLINWIQLYSHLRLARLRPASSAVSPDSRATESKCRKSETMHAAPRDASGAYGIPRGGLFAFVSCPHYLAEILIYFYLFLLLPSSEMLACLAFVTTTMFVNASKTHAWYRRTFGDEYPPARRALLPFLY
uniref:3-oxo-5-alpha-steroid 4-dehydrogenase family protein, related n=1 Tax=Neospora caninum (strain Liverpool) TaxID=572307 RepID=A0A0F7UHF8_NEOCL|nr:TPA: 3-oxo-5-alpha-steroid 4-dehydrogenase family protein, related [Neospora caninum Liverpool]